MDLALIIVIMLIILTDHQFQMVYVIFLVKQQTAFLIAFKLSKLIVYLMEAVKLKIQRSVIVMLVVLDVIVMDVVIVMGAIVMDAMVVVIIVAAMEDVIQMDVIALQVVYDYIILMWFVNILKNKVVIQTIFYVQKNE
ncbi:transmembrane protein, putative (macronuclear) [Tetrahymena thermophila SB210]|uniref:Transmembrane protein, putative n=1 Tax=Tetrahymena thermophila (strain SB210) TaxID=312017 RepID=W7XJ57_TETTS|nr:transmembrane protein, putative [Tetrahymena thermophila SB210]EWS75231.1 transmembrane protein, putative [Tetrahymena thermophila SB210]|eukprot:XP_012652222.1 transmembrane protein, putative [Tetrahymena thermophila SB210]